MTYSDIDCKKLIKKKQSIILGNSHWLLESVINSNDGNIFYVSCRQLM